MKTLIAVICCEYKLPGLDKCLEAINKHKGESDILLNYESDFIDIDLDLDIDEEYQHLILQKWAWLGAGKHSRQFDQDQNARLTPICIARNMVMDFTQKGGYDWLVFVDSDVIVPENFLSILENPEFISLRSGVIPGRGVHSMARYFGTQNIDCGDGWMRSDYYSCGLLAIPKEIFWRTRFRWGKPKESDIVASEDPIFSSDVRNYLGYNWFCKKDVICQHIGELKNGETSQF